MSEVPGIDTIAEGVDALLACDTSSVSDDGLGEALVELHRQQARLEAAAAKLTRAFDVRRAWKPDGSKSAGAWLKRHANTSAASATRQVRLARRLALMPATRAALAAGEIDRNHAEVLSRLAESPRDKVADAFVESEELLVDFARKLEFREFMQAVNYWLQRVDPDGVEDDADKAVNERRLHMSQTLDGRWVLDGLLDPVAGEIVHNELVRLCDEMFDQDWAEGRAEHGDDLTVDMLRTPPQRRADALVEMARRSAVMPADGQKPAPLITVLVDYQTFKGRVCELASGTVVPPGQVVALLKDDPWVERVVFGPKLQVLGVSNRTRFFRGAERRAGQVKYRTCTQPGCDEPAERCDMHHGVAYSQGGTTTADNGEPKCRYHHHWHHHHHQLALFPDGSPVGPDPPNHPDG